MVVSVLLKIKFGHAQISVPKISLYQPLPSKEKKSNKRKIIPKQIRSNKKCPLYKTYRKFLKINYQLKYGNNIMKETKE